MKAKSAFLFLVFTLILPTTTAAQSLSGGVALSYVAGSAKKVDQIVGDCDFELRARNGTCTPVASQTITRLNVGGTDLGASFEHNGKVIFVFGDTISGDNAALNYQAGDSLAWSTSTDPEAGLSLNFYQSASGSPLFVRMPGVNMGGNNVPNAGISLVDGIYLLANIGADSASGKPSDRSMLIRFDENARTFTAGRTVSTKPGRFIITSLYKHGSDVLIFGAGDYRASDVYLSIVSASSFATGAGTRYFTGLVNGQPAWSTTEADAVPVVQDNPLGGPAWPNNSPTIGNMSVVYSEQLKLWLMTFDGGRNSNTTGGVYFSYAREPWGPWAAPQLIFHNTRDNARGVFIHDPSVTPNPPGDGLNGPTIGPNDVYTTPGASYAPYMIGRFTTVVGDTLKIYFLLSTWNPYTVVKMRAEFKITTEQTFSVPDRGGASLISAGTAPAVSVGYGRIQPDSGTTTPSGVAIFGFRQDNVLVSEVGVPAVPALTSGRLYAEIAGSLNAGLAIANPNSTAATITFYFTDAAGNFAGSGATTVGANQQIAQFLDQAPFNVYRTATFQGTFSFTSTLPVAVVALRGLTNERGEFLMSTLPVINLSATASTGPVAIPHFADGGGWTTQVLLVNPTDETLTGTVQFFNLAGAAANVTIAGQTGNTFNYSVPRRSSQKLSTAGLAAATASGSIRVTPSGGARPAPLVVFSYRPAGVTVTEAGVPVTSGSILRNYVESSGAAGQLRSIDSAIAIANASSANTTVTLDLTDLSGAPVIGVVPVSVTVNAGGQTAKSLSELFPSLPKPFKGLVRIAAASSEVSVVGLRTRVNERGDYLITTTTPVSEGTSASSAELFFPQVADGGGYTTQFILFSGTASQRRTGTLRIIRQNGSPFPIQ